MRHLLAQSCVGEARAANGLHEPARVTLWERKRYGRRFANGRPGRQRCPVPQFGTIARVHIEAASRYSVILTCAGGGLVDPPGVGVPGPGPCGSTSSALPDGLRGDFVLRPLRVQCQSPGDVGKVCLCEAAGMWPAQVCARVGAAAPAWVRVRLSAVGGTGTGQAGGPRERFLLRRRAFFKAERKARAERVGLSAAAHFCAFASFRWSSSGWVPVVFAKGGSGRWRLTGGQPPAHWLRLGGPI